VRWQQCPYGTSFIFL